LNNAFLDQVDAPKGRWRDAEAEKKGIRPAYRWTGLGKDGLEVVYGTARARPSTTVVREVWKQRHGYRAAPLLLVVAYPEEQPNQAVKKRVRGVRPIERELQGRQDPQAEAVRGYCLAVRSAITDDGRPPLSASGMKLHKRIEAIHASIERVGKRGC
jgi:hypothetical protein